MFSSTKPACELALSSRPAPETPDFASMTTLVGIDRSAQRLEREDGRGRVAARIGDQRAGRRIELGDGVAPVGEPAGPRVLEAVPGGVERGVPEAVGAGQVDDDRVLWWLEHCGPIVAEAGEDDVRAGRERLLVRDEGGERAVQPDVERRGRFALERVRAEGDDLELRMAERAVERLLPGVPGCSEDRQRRHAGCILV